MDRYLTLGTSLYHEQHCASCATPSQSTVELLSDQSLYPTLLGNKSVMQPVSSLSARGRHGISCRALKPSTPCRSLFAQVRNEPPPLHATFGHNLIISTVSTRLTDRTHLIEVDASFSVADLKQVVAARQGALVLILLLRCRHALFRAVHA